MASETIALRDDASGLHGFLVVHERARVPAFGGLRLLPYAGEDEMLRDGAALALAMHRKVVIAGLPCGGGKGVLRLHAGFRRAEAWRALGRELERLGGRFHAGPDMGVGADDLAALRAVTRHVADPAALGDLGVATARGVLAGVRAAVPELRGQVAVVQGLGDVGLRVAEGLFAAGAAVRGADPNRRAAKAARALGVEIVAPEEALFLECDLLAPCARGEVVDDGTLPRLRARVIAGAANNVLAEDRHADALHERGILYVPDFVLNAGGVIRGARHALLGDADSGPAIDAIGPRVARLLERARAGRRPPWRVALHDLDEGVRSLEGT
jgi:leucine dehydrogenase